MPPRDVYMAKLFKPEISTGHPTTYRSNEGASSKGRTSDFDFDNCGSNPHASAT